MAPARKKRRLSPPGAHGLNVSFVDDRLQPGGHWQVEQDYETRPRQSKKATESTRLPIKTADGKVQRAPAPRRREEKDSSSESSDSEQELNGEVEAPPRPISSAEEIVQAQEEMGRVATRITEEPEENIGGLKILAQFARSENVAIKKLALAAQMAVFKDIIPGYRIRPRNEIEDKLSKEVRRIRTFEQSLLSAYEAYVHDLAATAKGKPEDGSQGAADLVSVASSCACKLLLSVPHFNLREDLIKVVVGKLSGRPSSRDFERCRSTLETVFGKDSDGHASYEAVVALSRMIKARDYRVDEAVLNTFLHLRLLTEFSAKGSHLSVDDPEAGDGRKVPKKKREFRTKSQRKALKENKKIEKEFRETDAVANQNELDRLQGETLKLVFGTYLRVLKARSAKLTGAVLEGLAKFAHLINQQFFGDLLEVLRELATQAAAAVDPAFAPGVDPVSGNNEGEAVPDKPHRSSDPIRTALLATTTAFSLLSAQDLSRLSLDLSSFTSLLYGLLVPLSLDPDIEKPSRPISSTEPSPESAAPNKEARAAPKVNHATSATLLTRALSAALLAPPSQISPLHLAAFAHRLTATAALHAPARTATAALALVQAVLVRRSPSLNGNAKGGSNVTVAAAHAAGASGGRGAKLAGLWSTEARRGDGRWDPEAGLRDGGCAPFCGTVWAGELLRLHYAQGVKEREGELGKMVSGLLGGH